MSRHPGHESFAGQYRLHVGLTPAITGHRPVLAPGRLKRLLRGQTGEHAVQTLGQIFTLCAHAHRACAQRAIAAALAGTAVPLPTDGESIQSLDCARDHLRCITLDWPQRLGVAPTPSATNLAWLQGCPLPLGAASSQVGPDSAHAKLCQLAHWLSNTVLQQALPEWLAQHRDPAAMLDWCRNHAHRLPPARALAAAQALLNLPALPLRMLHWDDEASLRILGETLWREPEFCEHPTWGGACAETGAWARARHGAAQATYSLSAWSRLSARWIELVELANHALNHANRLDTPPDTTSVHTPALAQGTLVLETRRALAWCEMARGLLVHSVELDCDGRIADYRVLAPTEWNFHPQGSLAMALATLPTDCTAQARLLAMAYDPCVDCTV